MRSENHLKSDSDLTKYESIVCGASAGLISRFVVAPFDLVKIRMQLHSTYGAWELPRMVRLILKNEGIRAFWKGNCPAELMYVLYSSIQYSTLRLANHSLAEMGLENETVKQLISGGFAGSVATLCSYPLDYLRTRTAANMGAQSTLVPVILQTWKREGIPGFYHGSTATLVSVFPYMGLFFGMYSWLRERLDNYKSLPSVLTAASIASVLSKAAVYPLDTIRKRVQVHGNRTLSDKSSVGFGHQYSHNFWRAGQQIVAREGAGGLYCGFIVSLFKSLPGSTSSILIFEATLNLMRQFS